MSWRSFEIVSLLCVSVKWRVQLLLRLHRLHHLTERLHHLTTTEQLGAFNPISMAAPLAPFPNSLTLCYFPPVASSHTFLPCSQLLHASAWYSSPQKNAVRHPEHFRSLAGAYSPPKKEI